MNQLFLVLFLLTIVTPSFGQKLLTWDAMTDVKFTPRFSEELGIEVLEATFGESIKAMDNQLVIIKGYIIPLDPMGTKYVLSKYPMAMCFFCGKAGPETVIELRLHPKSFRRYAMDEQHTFQGTLRLNEKNPESLNFIIEEAVRM